MRRINEKRNAALVIAAVMITGLANAGSAQELDIFDEVKLFPNGDWQLRTFKGPTLDDVPGDGIAVADVDTLSSELELLVHRGATITWYDLIQNTSGQLMPAPPVAVDALVGIQVLAGPRLDVVMANGSDLWVLDLDALAFGWRGPFDQGFAITSLAAVDLLGGLEEDLVATDGTQVLVLDLATPSSWLVLPTTPAPVDAVAAVDVSLPPPYPLVTRLLAAHVFDAAAGSATTYHLDPVAVQWDKPQDLRYRIFSSAPLTVMTLPQGPLGERIVPTAIETSPIRMRDVAGSVGLGAVYDPGGDGHCPGAVFTDLDGDNAPDLYLVRGDPDGNGPAMGAPNLLFLNDGSGAFLPMTGAASAADAGNGAGALAADFTGDGLRDLFVVNMEGPNALYERQSNGSYQDITPFTDPTQADDDQAGLAAGCDSGESEPGCTLDASLAAAAGDFNRDGLLDLYVGNHQCCEGFTEGERDVLYLNDGVGIAGEVTFTDVTVAAGIVPDNPPPPQQSSTQALLVADFDGNGWPDIYLTHKGKGPLRDELFLNDGNPVAGVPRFNEYFSGQPDPDLGNITCQAMGIDVADYDNDGDLDIFLTDISGNGTCADPNTFATDMDLYRNRLVEDGVFSLEIVKEVDGENPVASPNFAWGASWSDFDNDGNLDLHVSSATNRLNWLHHNLGDGAAFADATVDSGAAVARGSRASVPADFAGDGRVDLLVAHRDPVPVSLFRNETPVAPDRHWLGVRLEGNPNAATPFASTRDAVGARIEVFGAGPRQRRDITVGGHSCASTRDTIAYFGVGSATTVSVKVFWPSGQATRVPSLAVDQVIFIAEP